jgi:hypothetical protein
MHALIIREPWIELILRGKKTWEMRSTPTHIRGRVGLIRKGTGLVVGVAEITDCLAPLDGTLLAASRDRHGIPAEKDRDVLAAGWLHPWVLQSVTRLPRPVASGQKAGQVIWVPLATDVVAAIDAQVGAPIAAAPSVNAPAPAPKPSSAMVPPQARILSAPVRIPTASGSGADEVTLTLTDGAIRNGNLSIRNAVHLLPDSVFGGSNRSAVASGRLTVVFDPGETVDTDIASDKMTLRCRGAVSDFFRRSGARNGDRVALRRDTSGALRVRIMPR